MSLAVPVQPNNEETQSVTPMYDVSLYILDCTNGSPLLRLLGVGKRTAGAPHTRLMKANAAWRVYWAENDTRQRCAGRGAPETTVARAPACLPILTTSRQVVSLLSIHCEIRAAAS